MTSMDEAHRRDYADKAKLRDLRTALEAFVADPPRRAWPNMLSDLCRISEDLEKLEDHIVAVWD